jgi:cation-transporting ATPase E
VAKPAGCVNSTTVSAPPVPWLAAQAGLGSDLQVVSGLDLAAMCAAEVRRVAEEASIFGRITPQQKERLIQALQEQGAYVAMIGDGVPVRTAA